MLTMNLVSLKYTVKKISGVEINVFSRVLRGVFVGRPGTYYNFWGPSAGIETADNRAISPATATDDPLLALVKDFRREDSTAEDREKKENLRKV